MPKEYTSLRLDAELIARVDAIRGDVPRTRWLENAIRSRLASEYPDDHWQMQGAMTVHHAAEQSVSQQLKCDPPT